MVNTSATGGYLTPTVSPAPLEDELLANFIQEWVVGITGLAGQYVRPRWQAEPPNIPQSSVNWAAVGIVNRESDMYAVEQHLAGGTSQIKRHEVMNILASFYGPAADSYAHLLREGMQLAQNREVLTKNNMGLVNSGEATTVPELVKERWLYRVDLPFSIRRQIIRTYSVLNLNSATIQLNNEQSVTNINVVP